jgi:hypothetical protein
MVQHAAGWRLAHDFVMIETDNWFIGCSWAMIEGGRADRDNWLIVYGKSYADVKSKACELAGVSISMRIDWRGPATRTTVASLRDRLDSQDRQYYNLVSNNCQHQARKLHSWLVK